MELDELSLCLVGNIPGTFHSSDLRAFFSQYVEKGNFTCFHYRHRPEYQSPTQTLAQPTSIDASSTEGDSSASHREARTHCCVVAVVSGAGKDFVRNYHNTNWTRSDGEYLGEKVRVTKLRVLTEDNDSSVSHSNEGTNVWWCIAKRSSFSTIL